MDLTDYPRPSVAVDTALLTVDSELKVVLVTTASGPRLPGTFVHERETLAEAVLRSLRSKAGITGLAPRQLRVFDDPYRDDRGWVMSVAHLDVVPIHRLGVDPALTTLVPVDHVPLLPWGHEQIVAAAVHTLRADYRSTPDPARLLPRTFTLRELQTLHEAVAGHPLPRDTFRRSMEPLLEVTGETAQRGVGKPARLFTHQERTSS